MSDSRARLSRNDLLDLDDDALLGHCHQERYRASGPGGQHRNTTDSAVRLSLLDGAITALCADHRSQYRNRAGALRRLRAALAIQMRMPLAQSPPRSAPLSASSVTEAPAGRAAQDGLWSAPWDGSWALGRNDRRYARFIAHLLDVIAHHHWAMGHSAKALGVSTGKLVRTLSKDAHAWDAVNQARTKFDLVKLRQP